MKKSIFKLFIFTIIAFSACNKMDFGDDKNKEELSLESKCFDLVYPISFTMSEGTTETYNDKDEFYTGMETWKAANPNATTKPTLNYPVQVTLKDGTTKTISDESEMILLKKSCSDKKEECFGLVYPISFTMPDGATETYNDEKEFYTGMETWKAANPNATTKPTLNYPVQVTLKDGTTKTISDESEMILLKKSCSDKKEECFGLVYPISFTMPDGTTETYNDEKEFYTGMENWKAANPNATTKPTLNYPVQVTLKDGTTKTISNETEMILLKKSC